MEVRPVQFNINTKSNEHKHYLEAEGAVDTTGLVKPLPGKGHLIHDDVVSAPVYFVKDIAYDMKSLKNGIKGTANDHQLGRLNDVGLQVGGVGIATYLASKTTNPKARIMEYAGLAAFLTAMNVYPKIAINAPARIIHGYDIGKWYIDDQGRKKSVNQDSNYRPMDLYRGDVKGETLDEIGDKMGIPRDIKNRHEIIKEQTRKNSTQSNTLWMLTAGFATPVMTALACYGLENYVISPQLEKARNNKYNKLISETLEKTKGMSLQTSEIAENDLSSKINSIISKYKGQELPKEELDRILEALTENMGETASEGLREDVANIIKDSLVLNGQVTEDMSNAAKKQIPASKMTTLEPVLVPSREEIQEAIKKIESNADFTAGTTTSTENLHEIKKALRNLIDGKLDKNLEEKLNAVFTDKEFALSAENLQRIKNAASGTNEAELENAIVQAASEVFDKKGLSKESKEFKAFVKSIYRTVDKHNHLTDLRNDIVNSMIETMQSNKTKVVTEDSIVTFTNLAKILGEFKANQRILDKCSSFKFEFAPETALARSYGKFEKALIKELGISMQEMKKMRESEEYTAELLNKKITELCQDETRYRKTFDKLSKIISEMEVNLNGASQDGSQILDLINAIENNYNNTAKRLANIGDFKTTITRLVNQDVATLGNSITTRQQLFDFLDGIVENKFKMGIGDNPTQEAVNEYARYNADGLASSKHQEISRILERYQGVKNSFNRVLHTFEVFKRTMDPNEFLKTLSGLDGEHRPLTRTDVEYIQSIIKRGRQAMLTATSADHNLKLDLVNNPMLYTDIMNSIWAPEKAPKEAFWSTKARGYVTDIANEAMGQYNTIESGNVLDRFQTYITRFRNIVANSPIDFTKPFHGTNEHIRNSYTQSEKTRMAFFNLVGQSPVDFFRGAAKREYGTKKWFQIVSGVTAGVFAATILAQAGFGKIRNPHNIKKQVSDETNK